MQAALLRKRLIIQSRSQVQDDYGQPLTAWVDVETVWGAVEPVSGRESISADAMQSSVTYQVVMRYRPGITAKMRIKYDNRFFDIQDVIDENERHRMLTLLCVEGLSDG
ncbi:phage head closure protein [Polynucleobacter sp. AP-Nino-20-G2]|uniref:phage head closure protein n=1 Tax=Polynucleobacter sp. AP-Nino-20-G2 TaxID=2576917 RepID=UPI001BFEB3A6|nr:phage head closure protein [Polynucleobacter sp. AP-Nino-20-G2]QWE17311.1 phage head closure protein [Polynucleobacter sp. AP-Nino-20-G2]